MAPRPPTLLEQLRETGRYIDHSLLPTQNEIPGILAALTYGQPLADKIAGLRQEGLADVEIMHEVAHTIAPPDPDAGATVTQGVPTAAHEALQAEVAQLRGLVESLAGQRLAAAQAEMGAPPAPPAPTPPPVAGGAEMTLPPPAGSYRIGQPSAESQVAGRLAADPALAEQTAAAEAAQREALARATGEHPTAEPVVSEPSEVDQLRALVANLGGNPDEAKG